MCDVLDDARHLLIAAFEYYFVYDGRARGWTKKMCFYIKIEHTHEFSMATY